MRDREYLTKAEVLELLRISKGTLDKIMKRRELPYFKFSRRVLFKRSDIDKWLESKRVK